MKHTISEGDILFHAATGSGHLLATTDQDEHGQIRIAIAQVRELARQHGLSVYAVDRLDGHNLEPVDVQVLEDSGWVYAGKAVASHTVEVACGRGGGSVLDNTAGGVE